MSFAGRIGVFVAAMAITALLAWTILSGIGRLAPAVLAWVVSLPPTEAALLQAAGYIVPILMAVAVALTSGRRRPAPALPLTRTPGARDLGPFAVPPE